MAEYLAGYEALKVLGARAVIKLEKEENKTQSGLILTSATEEPKFEGQVVAIGDGARLQNGTRIPMDVRPGERVIYSRTAGVPVNYKGEDFLVINERDIVAVIQQ